MSDHTPTGPTGAPQPSLPSTPPPPGAAPWPSAGAPQAPSYPGSVPPPPPGQPAAPQGYAVAAPTPGYAPPAPGYAPQPPGYAAYPAYQAPRPASGAAIASLVCGIGGLVFFWLAFPVLASIAAVITGHMALKRTKNDPSIGGRGLAIGGLITGYAGLGIFAIELIVVVMSFVLLGAFTVPFLVNS